MSGLPLGATPDDTGEFFLGRVGVVPVLFDSNGQVDPSTEDWTPVEIEEAIAKVRNGVQWWADTLDTLDTVHKLEFVIDESFARTPFSTPYEPISRMSQDSTTYITPFLRAQGIEDANSLDDAVRQFNHAARLRLETDWAFTIFLIDSSNDEDGQFAPGSDFSIAFAFAGGLYVVSPSTRPTSTITHEMGHIFWARDEYPGGATWTDRRGYYNAQNVNAYDNPTPGFVQEVSIMRAGGALTESYENHTLPASTRAMIGWLDSDGDGIFDLADVPLRLEGDGRYDAAAGVFRFEGFATSVALPNQNSEGPQNDITLNRVDRIEYRVNGGAWLTAQNVDKQSSDIQFQLVLPAFDRIELRAIDDSIGVTSPILLAQGSSPIVSGASISGFVFVDVAGEGEKDPSEALLAKVVATVTQADGSPLFSGRVEPDEYLNLQIPASVSGANLTAKGATLDGRIGSFVANASTGASAFHYYNRQGARWQNAWSVDRVLEVQFDETVGRVELDAIGLINESGTLSYGRLEAYDAAGTLLDRFTTGKLANLQVAKMVVEDPRGRIASIRAFGHQFSSVGLDSLQFGTQSKVVTGADGVFRFPGLPDGDYRVGFVPERMIYRYVPAHPTITVSSGVANPVIAGFERVASPWRNLTDRFDVDNNGRVVPLDALRIINDIARNGVRILANPGSVSLFVDTSDDGAVTAVDALRVINEIARRNRAESGEGEKSGVDQVFAAWPGDDDKLSPNDPLSPYFVEPFLL